MQTYTARNSCVYVCRLLCGLVSYVISMGCIMKSSWWVWSLFWKRILFSSHCITGKKCYCKYQSHLFSYRQVILRSDLNSLTLKQNHISFQQCATPFKEKRTLLSFLSVLFHSILQRNILLIKTDHFIFSKQITTEETNTFKILTKLKVTGFPHL